MYNIFLALLISFDKPFKYVHRVFIESDIKPLEFHIYNTINPFVSVIPKIQIQPRIW